MLEPGSSEADKGQQIETETREVLTRHKKNLSCHEDSQVVEQVPQRSCTISIFEGFQALTG